MKDCYKPLLLQLSKPLLCPEHSLEDCPTCVRGWIDFQNERLIRGAEELLLKVATEDARYMPDNTEPNGE